jgi:hypothetical protein
MPEPALPAPLPEPTAVSAGSGRFIRYFRDALGRPLRGRITLAPVRLAVTDDTMVLPVPVVIELTEGLAQASLPPGDYLLAGVLRTVDRAPAVVSERITVGRFPS